MGPHPIAPLRIYLTGEVWIEAGERLIEGRQLGGRQGRLAFAYLAAERARAVPQDELGDALWPEGPPPSGERALSAIVSHLRSALGRAGLPRSRVIDMALGCYQLRLPPDAWVDVEAADQAIDHAEGALREGDPRGAYGWANVALAVSRRPFLAGEDGFWVETRRTGLALLRVRSLDCLADVFMRTGEWHRAIRVAEEAVALEPFRESGYRNLMRAHAAAGNRAEALRAYHRCRRLLADELEVEPSEPTRAVYLDLARS